MDVRTLRVLEFDKIIERLKAFAVSAPGREHVEALVPFTEESAILDAIQETADAESCILKRGNPPLIAINDIRSAIARLEVGSTLNAAELLRISGILRSARTLKKYFVDTKVIEEQNIVGTMIDNLVTNRTIELEIDSAIVGEEEISDSASPALSTIRRQIKSAQDNVKSSINDIIHSQRYQKFMQDAIVTMRGDRYVVPVKAEYKSEIPGLVHDSSGSGATLFIEPLAVVEANNKIKQLKIAEMEEINRILAELSAKCAEITDDLHVDLELLGRLDFAFAKGKFSLDMNCTVPKMNTDGRIVLKKARHPLLDKKKVVSIDFEMGNGINTMIVTGPNTGGKTVSLKTVGLFTLMAQAGLCVPAENGTELAIYKNIFADIGDEQSIEQSLSTFSSHMSNIIKLTAFVDDKSLVLLDELGAGTDPTEGAALAISILEMPLHCGATTMATTHYSELKEYALSTKGVQNASCEFDVTTLRPTYRLLVGVPGRSNAFAICERLGLDRAIIERAKELLSAEAIKFDEMMVQLEERKVVAERERDEALRMKSEAEQIRSELAQKKSNVSEQRERILREAREEAREIVSKAKQQSDELVSEIKQIKVAAEEEKANAELRDSLRVAEEKRIAIKHEEDRLDGMLAYSFSGGKSDSGDIDPNKLENGQKVLVVGLGQEGVIESKPDKNGEVRVKMGVISMNVKIGDLKLINEAERKKNAANKAGNGKRKAKPSAVGVDLTDKRKRATMEIDVRGSTVQEACEIIDKFIDDAYLAGMPEVCIIHGKGTGALRAGVQSFLRKNSHVRTFRSGVFGEGENGVTIVSIKQ